MSGRLGGAAAVDAGRDSGPRGSAVRTRVLWLIKGLGAGGAERLLVAAAQARDRDALAAEAAFLLPWKDALVGDLRRVDVPVSCLRGEREWDLRWALRLRRLLLDRSIDVLHVHSPYVAGVARLVARSLARRRRPRVVYTEHLPWSGYAWPTRMLNAMTYVLDDAHVAVSRAVWAGVPRLLRRRLEVVVHGIDLERVRVHLAARDDIRRELGLEPGELVAGIVANVRPQKRYPDLLQAARRVVDSGAPVRFLAAGGGSDDPEIERLHADLELGERFRFLGPVEDASRILAASDLFVLASEFEGLPVAMMEALALGLPVVATRVAGIVGEVRDGEDAVLVPVARPDLLAEAIGALARDPERRRSMSRAAFVSGERFDLNASVRRLEAVYRELTGRSARTGGWRKAMRP